MAGTCVLVSNSLLSGNRVKPVLQSRKQVIRSYCPNINTVFIGFLKRILTSGNHQGINAKIAADKALKPYSQLGLDVVQYCGNKEIEGKAVLLFPT